MATSGPRSQSRQRKQRAPRGTRVVGYVVAAVVNVAFIWLVKVAPGWRWLPILSDDFSQVVGLLTFSFVVSVVVNLVYVAFDPPWMKHLGEALTASIAAVVMLQVVVVFPFDLGSQWAGWETPLRVLMGVGCAVLAIAAVANLALLARDVLTGTE